MMTSINRVSRKIKDIEIREEYLETANDSIASQLGYLNIIAQPQQVSRALLEETAKIHGINGHGE